RSLRQGGFPSCFQTEVTHRSSDTPLATPNGGQQRRVRNRRFRRHDPALLSRSDLYLSRSPFRCQIACVPFIKSVLRDLALRRSGSRPTEPLYLWVLDQNTAAQLL